ncbi:MAG: T9SS type A sorting domain-containing protein [Elusimicrobia bacterium]|nr:T9SS type A sorting domain-containing protein [Elusimicrobiota bacterium]
MFSKINKVNLISVFSFLVFTSLLLADVSVAPVPWIPESGKAKTGTLAEGVTFRGVPSSGEISIYTISGNLVRKIECNNDVTVNTKWDGKNDSGQYVSSGVYLWVVKSSEKTQTGKLIVVR